MNTKCGGENNWGEITFLPEPGVLSFMILKRKKKEEGIVKAVSQWQKQELLLLRDHKFWSVNVTFHT